MSKIDITGLRIDETEFYYEYCSYNHILERHNITEVSQLFDDEYMKTASRKFRRDYQDQLSKLIELLKYRYLGKKEITNTELLDEEISVIRNKVTYIYSKRYCSVLYLEPKEEDDNCYWRNIDLEKLLALPQSVVNKLVNVFLENIDSIMNAKEPGETIKVIDFIKFIVENESTLPYKSTSAAKVYSEVYDTKKIEKDDRKITDEIIRLTQERDRITKRISELRKLQRKTTEEKPKVYQKED